MSLTYAGTDGVARPVADIRTAALMRRAELRQAVERDCMSDCSMLELNQLIAAKAGLFDDPANTTEQVAFIDGLKAAADAKRAAMLSNAMAWAAARDALDDILARHGMEVIDDADDLAEIEAVTL